MFSRFVYTGIIAIIVAVLPFTAQSQTKIKKQQIAVEQFQPIADSVKKIVSPLATVYGRMTVDTVYIYSGKYMDIHISRSLSEFPLRDNHVKAIYSIAYSLIPSGFEKYKIKIYSSDTILEDLASAYYSGRDAAGKKAKHDKKQNKWVTDASVPYTVTNGLQNSHIGLWQSHGYYYEQKLLRWEWQRARIFQTVEDLYTQSYVLPFLVPMLENAGAYVALPRERDSQVCEVIVDNDTSSSARLHGSYNETMSGNLAWCDTDIPGFADFKDNYEFGENPFTMGTARKITAVKDGTPSIAQWSPEIPQNGEYAVYVSYQTLAASTDAALYTVYHNGGSTSFIVNQKMGGSTWVYLGTFSFSSGKRDSFQGVALSNVTPKGKKFAKGTVVTADAVKFGGGMGNIARKPGETPTDNLQSALPAANTAPSLPEGIKPLQFIPESEISGYPRYTEGARYWLQWAGFCDTIYSPNRNLNDYNDDYMSRGRWINVLSGGSDKNPGQKGYNVPLDLAMAFHTDAGTTLTDSIIGTLAIYTRYSEGKDMFPDGRARIESRELADMIQTQIVDDIHMLYEPKWIRRGLWDRSYSESRTPVVPTMLLELLSHQNLADMRYGLDPNFRFSVSRAIYKAILRFQSERYGFEYTVQPLPVKSFSAVLKKGNDISPVVHLSWIPVSDPLEPTAQAEKYVVYTRIFDPSKDDDISFTSFDNGVIVEKGTSIDLPVEPGKIYSYKITAVNAGGESFPSEILSIGTNSDWLDSFTVLVMNGFDRVSAPASFATSDSSRAGFADYLDGGVPYQKDFSFIGSQHEYRREIPWMDDDAPGFGASYANYEDKIVAGNTFDYPFVHGIAIMNAGYNFVSASRDAVTGGIVSLEDYPIVDMIMGKQVKTRIGRDGVTKPNYEVFPIQLQKAIMDYCRKGGNLLVSGSYVASDIWDHIYKAKPKASLNNNVKALSGSIRDISSQIRDLLGNIYKESGEVIRSNDSLGFAYYKYDSVTVAKIAEQLLNSGNFIDSLNRSLNAASASISSFERGTNAGERSKDFAQNVLKFRWMTHYASSTGEVKPVQNPFGIGYNTIPMGKYSFDVKPNEKCYAVESPDGLVPVGENAWTVFRYADNNISAGVAYKGEDYRCVTLGFPIEALLDQEEIDAIIGDILNFLAK